MKKKSFLKFGLFALGMISLPIFLLLFLIVVTTPFNIYLFSLSTILGGFVSYRLINYIHAHKITKKKIGCACLLIIVLGFFITNIFVTGALNYSGMCIPERRYLSDEEKAVAVMKGIKIQAPLFYNKESNVLSKYKIDSAKKYDSVMDFVIDNPSSFRVYHGSYSSPSSIDEWLLFYFFDRTTGFLLSDIIKLNFTLKYIDRDGNKQIRKFDLKDGESNVYIIKNCGKLRENYRKY